MRQLGWNTAAVKWSHKIAGAIQYTSEDKVINGATKIRKVPQQPNKSQISKWIHILTSTITEWNSFRMEQLPNGHNKSLLGPQKIKKTSRYCIEEYLWQIWCGLWDI